jgi:hypothetical protein
MVAGRREVGGGTSPSKVYAKRERTADFLLAGVLSGSDLQFVKGGLELFGRLENDTGHPEALGSFGIGGNVVNIYGFFRADFAGAERLSINERIGFAGADGARVNADVKQPEELEVGLHMGDVDRVGIRKNTQAVALPEFFQEGDILDRSWIEGAVPDFRELFEGERAAEPFGKVPVPLMGRQASFLPIRPTRIFLQGRPDFLGRKRDFLGQAAHGSRDIYADQDSADIEDDGSKLGGRHGLFTIGA